MATRWTNRLNPASWLLRRRQRPVPGPVVGGRNTGSSGSVVRRTHEFDTPPAMPVPAIDDFTAADEPSPSGDLEFFAESASQDEDESFETHPTYPEHTAFPERPRTWDLKYFPDSQRLHVHFRDGAEYEYQGFTESDWNSIRRATSTGRWLNRRYNMKPGGDGVRIG